MRQLISEVVDELGPETKRDHDLRFELIDQGLRLLQQAQGIDIDVSLDEVIRKLLTIRAEALSARRRHRHDPRLGGSTVRTRARDHRHMRKGPLDGPRTERQNEALTWPRVNDDYVDDDDFKKRVPSSSFKEDDVREAMLACDRHMSALDNIEDYELFNLAGDINTYLRSKYGVSRRDESNE